MSQRKIYVKFGRKRTIQLFLKEFFSNGSYYISGLATFRDEACTIQQCAPMKTRSFDDIFDLVATYYKTVTPKKLMHELLMLEIPRVIGDVAVRPYKLTMTHCSTIRRINMYYYTSPVSYARASTLGKYQSVYSWKQLLDMIGVKNQEQLENYRENFLKTKNGSL